MISPDFFRNPFCETADTFGVNLSHSGRGVTQNGLGRVQPVRGPNPRGERMPQLVRVPVWHAGGLARPTYGPAVALGRITGENPIVRPLAGQPRGKHLPSPRKERPVWT